MQCRDARELLDSFVGGELLVETNHELLQHLVSCPACTTELEERRHIRSRLKQAFDRSADLRMRPEFAEVVAVRLRASMQPRSQRAWRSRWVALAASALVATGAVTLFLRSRPSDVARLAAGDHLNCAVKFALAEKPISLQEAAARYDAAFARLESIPPDTVPSAAGTLRVADRHSCVFGGRRFGHLVFKLNEHLVSALMTADDVANRTAVDNGAGHITWLPREDELAMASFRYAGHIVYVVSDLDDRAFRAAATALAQPLSLSASVTIGFEFPRAARVSWTPVDAWSIERR